MHNLFDIPPAHSQELCETLCQGAHGMRVERIVSWGHTTPKDQWYDQRQDEWVLVLQGTARLCYENGQEISLCPGSHVFLPKHCKHRVSYTSTPCLWLAIHGELTQALPDASTLPTGSIPS